VERSKRRAGRRSSHRVRATTALERRRAEDVRGDIVQQREGGRSVGIGGDVDVGDPSRRRRYVVDAKISGARAERSRGFAGPQGAFARLTRRGAGVSWALTCGGDADLGVEWGLDVKRRWRRKDGDGDGDGGGDGDGDGGGGKEKETPFVSISLRTSSRGGLENTKVYVQRGVE